MLLLAAALPVLSANTGRQQQARLRRLRACVALIPCMGELNSGAGVSATDRWSGDIPDPDAVNRLRSPDPNPYVFYVLDQRKELKPDGWEFFNPAAPPFPSLEQQLRWPGLTQATPLREDMGAYWEVVLSQANFAQLAQMDVIYVPISRQSANGNSVVPTYFTEEQRRILTRLADSGVTIWVDWALPAATVDNALGGVAAGPNGEPLNNAFFTSADFATYSGSAQDPLALAQPVSHPLLSDQFVFQTGDALNIGESYGSPLKAPSTNRAINIRPSDMQPTANFAAVVPVKSGNAITANRAYVAASRFGAGYVVLTAGNVGDAIDKMIPSTTLRATTEDLGLAETEDLKFAYNMFGWRAEVTAQQKNGRHTGQSSVQLSGAIEQFSYPYLTAPAAAKGAWQPYPPSGATAASLPINPTSPLIVNNMLISATRYASGGSTISELCAFDLRALDDQDGNGFSDDGIAGGGYINRNTLVMNSSTGSPTDFVDLGIGLPYDMFTKVPNGVLTGAAINGMCVGEVPESGPQQAKAFVYAATLKGLFSVPAPRTNLPLSDYWNNSTFVAADALPGFTVKFNGAPGFANVPGAGSAVDSEVFAGGSYTPPLFGSANSGKVISYSAFGNGKLTPQWYYPPNQEANRLGLVSGPVVAAQVVDAGTGAVDTMAFFTSCWSGDPTGGQAAGGAGDTTGKVEGVIVATRGDVLGFPRGNNAPGGGNPTAGRRFVSTRWLDITPGVGQVPQTAELIWDPGKHYEVRVMDKARNYVLARFLPNSNAEFQILRDGTGGQVQLPPPTGVYADFAKPGHPGIWDLDRFVLLADYSVLPTPVDTGGQTIRPRFSPSTPYERNAQQAIKATGIGGGVAVGKDNLVYYGTGIGYMCAVEWRKGRPTFRWKMRSLEHDENAGTSQNADPGSRSPAYLNDFVFKSAPAAGDRIVFASQGVNGGPGTVYVLDPDATIRFKLRVPNATGTLTAGQAQQVMLLGDHGLGLPPTNPFLMSTQQPWGRVPNQFVVDPDTATVTFLNMENFSLDLRQAVSPAQLAAIGIDSGGKPAVPIQWKIGQSDPNTHTDYIPLPVVAIYRGGVPGGARDGWSSGPVVAGDRVYAMGNSGFLHQVSTDPKRLDSSFPRNGGVGLEPFDIANYGAPLRKTPMNVAGGLVAPGDLVPAPAIADGTIAVSTGRGVTVYGAPNVVVADSNRIIEASGDSTALATTDVVLKHRIDTSDFPIPTDPSFSNAGNRPILTERQQLNHPAKVVKLNRSSSLTALFMSDAPLSPPADSPNAIREHSELAEESYLVADSGNNRCLEFNPIGKVVWELKTFQDPFKLLPSGESVKLSNPMDVQRWIEREDVGDPARFVYVIHTLVADTGNTRILEIVDKVEYQGGSFTGRSFPTLPGQVGTDGQPVYWYHVLAWCSQTNSQGLRLRYRTAQRIFWTDATGAPIPISTANPGPPYLPTEPYLSYTMAVVAGQRVSYPDAPLGSLNGFFKFYTLSTPYSQAAMNVVERKPDVRSGGDSIVFLRGRWKVEKAADMGAPPPSAVREGRQNAAGGSLAGDSYLWGQGVIDPNIPTITDIWDDMVNGTPAPQVGNANAKDASIHRLNGVQSVQRTIRADVKFAPDTYTSSATIGSMLQQYFLIADADGVWEFRMLPAPFANAGTVGQFRLSWAFATEDYAYISGAGNGDPTRVNSPSATDQDPGGRQLSPISARRLPNGLILICSRPPGRDAAPGSTSAFRQHQAGADVFLLRASDYLTATDRAAINQGLPLTYDRRVGLAFASGGVNYPLHGWKPEFWVQQAFPAALDPSAGAYKLFAGGPSLRWRAAETLDRARPFRRSPFAPAGGADSPYDLTGSYVPVQPAFADLVY
jgi:hypothetical protein